MTLLFYPIEAISILFFVIIPIFSFISLFFLRYIRTHAPSVRALSSPTILYLIIAPTLLPLLWLCSSVLHQMEPHYLLNRERQICQFPHDFNGLCFEGILLFTLLFLGLMVMAIYRFRHDSTSTLPSLLPTASPEYRSLSERLESLTARDHSLKKHSFSLVHDSPIPLYTRGFFKHIIVIDVDFANACSDDSLHAAILHEVAHAESYDTLHFLIAKFFIALNPLQHLFFKEFSRWSHAREVACDSHAVEHGGNPHALALGLVTAARFSIQPSSQSNRLIRRGNQDYLSIIPLSGAAEMLHLRVQLLLEQETPLYPSEKVNSKKHHNWTKWLFIASLLMVTIIPHIGEKSLLESLHVWGEKLILWLSL